MKILTAKSISLPAGVLGLALSHDGKSVYACTMDGSVNICDVSSKSVTPLQTKHESYASGCGLVADGSLISAGYDGNLLWHDLKTHARIRRVMAHTFWSWQMAMSSDGKRVASVSGQYLVGGEKYEPRPSSEPTVKVFDSLRGELQFAFELLPPVLSVCFSPDLRHLAAANMMGDVRVWSLETGQVVGKFSTPDFTSWGIIKSPHYCGGIYGLSFSPDSQSLLACGMGQMGDPMAGNGKMTWQRWDWKEGKKLNQIGESGTGLMEVITHAADGSFLMAGRQAQGTWNVARFATDGKLLASLDSKSRITRAVFAPDHKHLYLASTQGQPKRTKTEWPAYGKVLTVALTDS